MPRGDSIDRHAERARIEYDLARGVAVREVAKKWGLSDDCCYRHLRRMPPQLRAALMGRYLKPGADLEKLKIQEGEGILSHLAVQRAKLLLMQDQMLEAGNAAQVASLSAQVHRNIQLVAEYLGLLTRHETYTSINILLMPQYLELRDIVREALRPFPEAYRALSAALHAKEAAAAKQIEHAA